jgi:hypothetical protein
MMEAREVVTKNCPELLAMGEKEACEQEARKPAAQR